MLAPAPGSTPMMNPVIEPLMKAKRQALSSSQLGRRFRIPRGTGSILALSPASMLARTSAMANTPIATTTKSIPPSNSDWPKT